MPMVEEFMLLANIHAAEFTYSCYKSCAVLRRHPQPSQEIFDDLKQKLKHYNIDLDTSSSIKIREGMENSGEYKELLQTLVTRCMQLAKYFSSGEYPYEEFYHYGLALPIYTHFTSPIRRYSDDMVHRLLAACINWCELPSLLSKNEDVAAICKSLNTRKEEADKASRDADKVFGVLFMIRKELLEQKSSKNAPAAKVYNAEITNLYKNRCTMLLRDFGVEVETKCEGISDDKMEALVDGQKVRVFQKVRVNVKFDDEHPWDFRLTANVAFE